MGALCDLCRFDFVEAGDPADHKASDRCAYNRILRWCRSNPRGEGAPVMRTNVDGSACAVLDVSRTEPKPGGENWERRDRQIAVGTDWRAVLGALALAGKEV